MSLEEQMDMKLIDAGYCCALANANEWSDHRGVCDSFDLCCDHVRNMDGFSYNKNNNISIDLYAWCNSGCINTCIGYNI